MSDNLLHIRKTGRAGGRSPFPAVWPVLIVFLFFTAFYGCGKSTIPFAERKAGKNLVTTWSTAPQLVEPGNMPPAPGLANNTLRQVIRVSLGGKIISLRLSNEFSQEPVELNGVQIAVSEGGSKIDPATIKELKFQGKNKVTLSPGSTVTSDPVKFDLKPRSDLAITICFGAVPHDITGHPGSRTTSYISAGNNIRSADFTGAVTTDHWYFLSAVDVKASSASGAVAILGNSITDGRGSGTNRQNRWPDILSERLLKNNSTGNIAVLNLGIGGNCVLRNCLGPAAVERFDRDILGQNGVRWVIVLEGVNDLGQARDSIAAMKIADELTTAYRQMAEKAHTKNIKIFGATILPFGKSFYYTGFREEAREKVNYEIRHSRYFDGIIDFDAVMRNPADSISLIPELQSGDFLHPNENGYRVMGEAVDPGLFR